MKRTKNDWYVNHPEDRTDHSGCTFFDGEDLHFQERKREYAATQKKWLDQQILEKEQKKQAEADEEAAYAMQTAQITRMRAMLEEELARKQREMNMSTRNANTMQNREFKDKNRANLNTIHKEEDDDYAHQTQVRIVDPYFNPLPDSF